MRDGYSKFIKKIDPCARTRRKSYDFHKYDFHKLDGFSFFCVKRVIDGEVDSLWYAFEWLSSPQGYDYWRKRATRLEELSLEDLDYLKAMCDYMRFEKGYSVA